MEKKKFLVCIDSDGCAIDTMEGKHKRCFAPLMVKTWGMQEHGEKAEEIWNRISLYSMDRGINRFKGLEMTLRECVDAGFLQEDLTDLREWIGSTDILSNQSLEEQIGKTVLATGQGGKHGGYSRLTEAAKQIIDFYSAF